MRHASLLLGAALLAAVATYCQSQQGQAAGAQAQQQAAQSSQQGVQPPAQVQPQAQPPAPGQYYGRGRGGLPWAWNDRDRDGICDLTGQPVGQGRPMGFGGGRGRFAGGFAGGRGRGWRTGGGRGAGGRFFGSPAAPAPAQTAPSQAPGQ